MLFSLFTCRGRRVNLRHSTHSFPSTRRSMNGEHHIHVSFHEIWLSKRSLQDGNLTLTSQERGIPSQCSHPRSICQHFQLFVGRSQNDHKGVSYCQIRQNTSDTNGTDQVYLFPGKRCRFCLCWDRIRGLQYIAWVLPQGRYLSFR